MSFLSRLAFFAKTRFETWTKFVGIIFPQLQPNITRVRHPAMQSLALTTTEKMGWIPDIPDHRDLFMTFSTSKEAPKEIHRNLGW